MVKDYGKICASSKSGKIFYGKRGTILWKDRELEPPPPPPPILYLPNYIKLMIPDYYGEDGVVKFCSFWSNNKQIIGPGWLGPRDSMFGPPPYLSVVNYHGSDWIMERTQPINIVHHETTSYGKIEDSVEVHFNWYQGSGPLTFECNTMRFRDDGSSYIDWFDVTVYPSENHYQNASPSDPGLRVTFTTDSKAPYNIVDKVEII